MADVAIIGGGIAGLWTALELLRAGASVTVFDGRRLGEGASTAAGGMLAPGAEGDGLAPAMQACAIASRKAWTHAAADIENASGIDIGYAECGSLIIARDDAEAAALKARCAQGFGAWLDSSALASTYPKLRHGLAGGAFVVGDACVDNRALIEALFAAVTQAGGTCAFGLGDVGVRVGGNRVLGVRAGGRNLDFPRVLLATGAWTSHVSIEGGSATDLPPVMPVKGQMGMIRVPALPMRELVWLGHTYLIPRRAGQLVLGATSEDAGFDPCISEGAVERLADDARWLVPSLAGLPVVERWCGFRPATPDGLPVLGQTRVDGLYVASGQYRNGILFGPLVARTMAACISGKASAIDISAFDPKRFGPRHEH